MIAVPYVLSKPYGVCIAWQAELPKPIVNKRILWEDQKPTAKIVIGRCYAVSNSCVLRLGRMLLKSETWLKKSTNKSSRWESKENTRRCFAEDGRGPERRQLIPYAGFTTAPKRLDNSIRTFDPHWEFSNCCHGGGEAVCLALKLIKSRDSHQRSCSSYSLRDDFVVYLMENANPMISQETDCTGELIYYHAMHSAAGCESCSSYAMIGDWYKLLDNEKWHQNLKQSRVVRNGRRLCPR